MRVLDEPGALPAVAALFATVWPDGATYPPELLRAIAHSGGYVAGLYDRGALVAASVALLARAGDELLLHSHVTGVLPGAEHAGRGFVLKQHQRAWAREQGLAAVTWTFDPLVRRNAWFNLGKLGAVGVAYVEDFYGPLPDTINRGDASDRLVVRWPVEDAPPGTPGRGADVVDSSGEVRPAPDGADVLNAWTPADIVTLRRCSPADATRWRLALRAGLGGALGRGYHATACTRDGCYTLRYAGAAR